MEKYEVSFIKNTVYVEYEKPDLSILDTIITTMEIILYCTVGVRSELIGEKVKNLDSKTCLTSMVVSLNG